MHIRMGTRGSALALAQCNEVKALLEKAYPQHSFEICVITTKGDRIQHVALDQMKDKGIFVKEIEQQLLEHTIDLAVHSMKDMPSVLDERLCFTETLLREDARDVLVLRNATSLESLPLHARIATGSKRRRFQLLRQREDLEIVGIRGNIETRLKKLEDQQLDGIVLAAAGLKRLQLAQYITLSSMWHWTR
ncbi:MAG: hydroxymethylbilane synthase [[Clostridium] innocuum]